MKPFDEAVRYLNQKLVGEAVKVPRLRKPRVITSVSLDTTFVFSDDPEAQVTVYFDDGYYSFGQGDDLEIV